MGLQSKFNEQDASFDPVGAARCLNASPHITSVRGMQGRKMSAGQAGKPRTVWTGKVPVGLSLLSGTGKIQVPLEL